MKTPEISNLSRRLQLERQIEIPDGAGGFSLIWESVATLWGDVETMSGRREFVVAKWEVDVTHRIIIRRRADINSAMRLRDGNIIYEIIAVYDADAHSSYQSCQCREVRS